MELSSDVYDKYWQFDMEALPNDLIRRGMAVQGENGELELTIKDYPYANDGLLIWDAIKKWASEYVKHYYPTTKDIVDDEELQGWWTEYPFAGYFPNRPTIARKNMPVENERLDMAAFEEDPEKVLLDTFPSQYQSLTVMTILNLLSTWSRRESRRARSTRRTTSSGGGCWISESRSRCGTRTGS
ncbi:hypothetical protein PR202_gb27908 [Eleusine coracana subsp. coracana]|uniref:Lipoxygenase domain-containing protein n=1 Tax=Eleusine coracana subsp. coracana TaxID=191504 RepID=A0AAV5FV17_ELECO|nr:hypothetical protein PR202_gb27908 [Eleusine coracana subsp. coracana]